MSFGLQHLLDSLGQRDLILPYFESSLLADQWPDKYTIEIDSSPYYGAGDGFFHPSTHAMKGERELYYMMHPDYQNKLVFERPSLQREMAFAMGSALHGVLQTHMEMTNLVRGPQDIEVEYVNKEHHVRGRIDWIAHHPNGSVVPVEMKALACSTPILTTRGWSTMGELQGGEEVFAPDGQPTKVLEAHPIRLGRPCYELRFRDGQSVVADAEHLWRVLDRHKRGRPWRTMTTLELAQSSSWGGDRHRFAVGVTESLQYPERELPIDPWLLGVWLGDGDKGYSSITCGEGDLPYLQDRLSKLGLEFQSGCSPDRPTVFSTYIYGIRSTLRAMALLGNKYIPERYLQGSEHQRRQLLAGLMNTDGVAIGQHQVSICMVDKPLMRQILQLVRSLGYRATWSETSSSQTRCGKVYWVKFSSRWGQSPFDMPRKRDKFADQREKGSTQDLRLNSIVSVAEVSTVPTRCITVAHESSLYVAGEGLVPTHNTRTAFKYGSQVEPEPSWVAQLNLGLDSQDLDLGVILMVESGYPFRMREWTIHRDRELLDSIYAKFDRVREAVEKNEPPRHCCPPDSPTMKKCPARHVCWLSKDGQ